MALEETGIDFSGEDWNVAHEFFDGAWVIAHRHGPGLNEGMHLNNRTFVFRLTNKGGVTSLVVFGCADTPAIEAVQKLAEETGLDVSFIVGNGGGHHMFLDLWYDAFPDSRILVPGTRVPRTRNGRELAEKYAARWELLHGPGSSVLADEFGDAIDVAIFDQLFLYDDDNVAKLGAAKNHRSERTVIKGFGLMKFMMAMQKDQSCPNDEVFVFHKASGLAIAGHNFQFIYTPKGFKPDSRHKMSMGGFPMSLMFSMMMPGGSFASSLEKQPQPIGDFAKHAATWQQVLDWPIRAWTSFHDPPTVCGPDLSGDEIKHKVRKSIAKTGEDDPTGARFKWAKKYPRS